MSHKKSDHIEMTPEQCDPLSYEIASLKRYIAELVAANDNLSPNSPVDQEQIYLNLYRLEQTRDQLKEMTYKQELRSKPSPAQSRYLRLVWSDGKEVQ